MDTDILDPVFAGRAFDEDLLRDLPADVDLCGEGRFWFRDVEAG